MCPILTNSTTSISGYCVRVLVIHEISKLPYPQIMNTCRLPFLEVISFLNFLYLTVMSSGYLIEAQIHNASQLEAWCIHFIATHYNAIYSQCPKPLKNLDSSTLMAIEKKRWPPPWYILEADWYQKAVQELDNEKAADKLRKSHKHVRHKRKCSCL